MDTRLGRIDPVAPGRDRPSVEVALDEVLALLAGQLVVVAKLEPGHAHIVEVDAAQQRARQVARRVQAGRLVDDQHAGDVEVGHALGHVVVDLAGEVDEVALAGEPVEHLLLVELEHARQAAGRDRRLGQHTRVGADALGRRRQCQIVAVAVEDRAPARRQNDRLDALLFAIVRVTLRADHLHVPEAHDHDPEHEPEHHEEAQRAVARIAGPQQQPGARRAAPVWGVRGGPARGGSRPRPAAGRAGPGRTAGCVAACALGRRRLPGLAALARCRRRAPRAVGHGAGSR
jgi:hypothetical protein